MNCFQRKFGKLPLETLPYGFQNRLTTIAPLCVADALSIIFQNSNKFGSCCPKVYDQVYITNNDKVHQWASKETFLFCVLKLLHQFSFLKYLLDGKCNINPIWNDVLSVDEIISKNQHIYVEDTLILFCDSINAYQELIPFIHGPYKRLILHGKVNSLQVKRLTHPGVRKVRINAQLFVSVNDYDDFADFVPKQVHGFNSRFMFVSALILPRLLKKKLNEACQRSKHSFSQRKEAYVVESKYFNCYGFVCYLTMVFCDFLITSTIQFVITFYDIERGSNLQASLGILMFIFYILYYILFAVLFYHPFMPDTIDVSKLQNTHANTSTKV